MGGQGYSQTGFEFEDAVLSECRNPLFTTGPDLRQNFIGAAPGAFGCAGGMTYFGFNAFVPIAHEEIQRDHSDIRQNHRVGRRSDRAGKTRNLLCERMVCPPTFVKIIGRKSDGKPQYYVSHLDACHRQSDVPQFYCSSLAAGFWLLPPWNWCFGRECVVPNRPITTRRTCRRNPPSL